MHLEPILELNVSKALELYQEINPNFHHLIEFYEQPRGIYYYYFQNKKENKRK